jgi:L-amino acid N-acyltransferase YncA
MWQLDASWSAAMAQIIRLVTLEDADQVQAIYAPFCIDTPVSFETEAPTVDEMRRRIVKTVSSLPWLVWEADGQIRGYAYASKHRERSAYRWSVDVSVYVREGYRRCGVGRALYASLLSILRLQGFYNALAGVSLPNPGSVGLHEAMGFKRLGVYQGIGFKQGAWHDVLWLQLELRERATEPDEPRDFQILLESDEWRDALESGLAILDPTGR